MAQWLRCCATNRKVAGSIPDGFIGIFHWYKILPIALWPWGRLSLWQKWVPGAFPVGKGGRCLMLTTLLSSCAVVMISGKLNFLEPSGQLQACNETALPLPLSNTYFGSYLRSLNITNYFHHISLNIREIGKNISQKTFIAITPVLALISHFFTKWIFPLLVLYRYIF